MTAKETTLEIEAKLLAPDSETLFAIGKLPGADSYVFRPRRTARLSTFYLDTEDFVLLRSRATVRLRRHGRRWEATAKQGGRIRGAVHERAEVTVALPGRPPIPFVVPAGPLRRAVGAIVADRALRPILVTEIRRRPIDVYAGDDAVRPVAEMALDEVRIRLPGRRGRELRFCEVEIELTGGSRRDVQRLAACLRRRFRLRPSRRSKFARGIDLLRAAGPRELLLFASRPLRG